MRVDAGVTTNPGRKRTRNEDYPVSDQELGLFLVVDGMGGHARGDIASRLVGDAIHTFIRDTAYDRDRTWPTGFQHDLSYNSNRMTTAVKMADKELARRIDTDAELRGMGATMTGALIEGSRAVISHVGDCRTYLIRDGRIEQLTQDHSWIAEQVRTGVIDSEDAKHHPLRNVVTRAVAGLADFQVDLREVALKSGDRLILCSDGLHGLITDGELLEQVDRQGTDPQAACDTLVDLANERGAPDNVTVIVVRVS
jgi:serine/threonine protein phosphatase PrpC